tara:strand:+ start:384 stop:989 length:606 start_codon:yes stop_codon:yes gene_type:complete
MSEIETTAPKVDVESSTAQPLPEHSTGAKVQPWLNVDASSASVKQVAPVQAEKVAPAVAFEPEAATPPAVAEKPKEPKPKENGMSLDQVLQEMKAERDRFKDLNDRHVGRERLQYLREIGAKEGVSDSDLMVLAPNADPTTAEGRAQLDEWRQKSSVYFEHKQAHPNVDINELSSGFKSSKQGTFGADLAAKILKSMGTKR